MEVLILQIVDGFVITCFGYTTVIIRKLNDGKTSVSVVPVRPISDDPDCMAERLIFPRKDGVSLNTYLKYYIGAQLETYEAFPEFGDNYE